MFVRIETSSGVPITRQIVDQIRAQCVSGELAPGERLPSVRVLARELAVNQNTILRVYERLTMEGLLERRHGDGTYVAAVIAPGQIEAQKQQLNREAEQLVYHARTINLDAEAVRKVIDQAFERMEQQGTAPHYSSKESAE